MGNSMKKSSKTIKNISNVSHPPYTDDITTKCMPSIFSFNRKKKDSVKQHIQDITSAFTSDISSLDTKFDIEPVLIIPNPTTYIKPEPIISEHISDIKEPEPIIPDHISDIKEPEPIIPKHISDTLVVGKLSPIIESKEETKNTNYIIKEKHRQLVDNIRVIQTIKVGDKLCITYGGDLSIDVSYVPFITRTLYGNNKNVTIDAVSEIILKGNKIRQRYIYINNLYNDKLIMGLTNLATTYKDKHDIHAKINVLIKTIN